MSDRERRVKDEAYRIWDEAGRPEGRGDEHWYEAEKRVAAGEDEPVPPARGAKTPQVLKTVVNSAGASGVVTAAAADDAPKPRLAKGAAVDIAPAKAAKTKDAPKARAGKPEKVKSAKDGPDKVTPAKAAKPKPRG